MAGICTIYPNGPSSDKEFDAHSAVLVGPLDQDVQMAPEMEKQ